MPDAETVVDALGPRRERREPALLLDAPEPPPAPRQDLVRIRLVADVPDQAVVGRVVDIVERDGELDGPEAGREMPAHRAHGLDQVLAEFHRERAEVTARERPEVGRRLDRRQQAIRPFLSHGGSLLEPGRRAYQG